MKDIIVITNLITVGLIPLATSVVMYFFTSTAEETTVSTHMSFSSIAYLFYVIILPCIFILGLFLVGKRFKNTGIRHPYGLIVLGILLFLTTFVPAYYLYATQSREIYGNLDPENVLVSYPIHGLVTVPYIYLSYLLTNKLKRNKKVVQ